MRDIEINRERDRERERDRGTERERERRESERGYRDNGERYREVRDGDLAYSVVIQILLPHLLSAYYPAVN